MQPVSEQATAMSRRAYEMAQRGMLFAARQELVQALQLVAQAHDMHDRSGSHAAALAAALTALKEADDFAQAPGRGGPTDVATIARGHRTSLVQGARDLPPVVAQQQYFNFAQQQLAAAAGREPAASQALYTLGKIQMALASQSSQWQSLDGPRALIYFQAALAVDERNYLAANELGVLLARYGQWAEARRALLHSVTTRPHAEGWHNLAVVHRRLGETDLARLADNERQLLAQNPAAAGSSATQLIRWVDPQTFAARGSHQQDWPEPAAARSPANPERR
jgi:tetratricopeptide (TPR) repeat protein